MSTQIKVKALKGNALDMSVWTGRIEVWENGKYIWSKSSGITRLCQSDAMLDAVFMRQDLQGIDTRV